MENYKLFVDLDGVLVDFDRGVKEITGKLPRELFIGTMWAILAKTPGFYDRLAWMPDGKELWETVRHLEPVILTGLPRGSWAEPQKRTWCTRELGCDVQVIACMTRDKAERARAVTAEGAVPVLIDDREKTRESWEAMGGVFIHHTDTETTLEHLHRLGLYRP
ncbi:MAG: glutathione S-transferase N-terminal domain-containing protein [Spirochaetales bacterium]|nr:glutathione S-transferase N-terminal domain-containing protein [Spirochaetales bacterium]